MRVCKICFSDIKCTGINALLFSSNICQSCFNGFNVIFKEEEVKKVKILFIYNYDETTKKYIFQLKGCFDIALHDIFLERYKQELKLRYKGYVIVPIPSTKSSDIERGFNHVIKIFEGLELPIIKCIEKKEDFKQSDLKKEEREKIKDKFIIKDGERLRNKKIVIVDDIYTTGSSFHAAVELLQPYNPKVIKGCILCKNCRNSSNFYDRK